MPRFLKLPLLLRLYRAGVLLAIVVLVHQQARWFEAQRGTAISLRQARRFFPAANCVQLRDAERGLEQLWGIQLTAGNLTLTSPSHHKWAKTNDGLPA